MTEPVEVTSSTDTLLGRTGLARTGLSRTVLRRFASRGARVGAKVIVFTFTVGLVLVACGEATSPADGPVTTASTSDTAAVVAATTTPATTTRATITPATTVPVTGASAATSNTASQITDVPAIIEHARRIDEIYGVYGPMSDDGTSADGSGCGPGSDVLPDGVWYVAVDSIDAGQANVDLICRYSGEAAFAHADYLGGDFVYQNESSRLRVSAVAPDAVIWLLADRGVPDSQTAMNSIEASTSIERLDFAPFVWALIEGGQIIELWESWDS